MRTLTPNPSPVARERGTPSVQNETINDLPQSPFGVRQQARDNRKKLTPSEQIFWRALRNRRFRGEKFRRQYPVGPYILHFYCPGLRVAVEIDGPIHAFQMEADAARQLAIETYDVRFVRIAPDLVESNVKAALKQVAAAIELPSAAHGRGDGGEGS